MSRRSFDVVMLAGALHPSLLRQQVGVPPLCLPLGFGATLLTTWIKALSNANDCADVRIVVNSEDDARTIRASLGAMGVESCASVVAEPASWRGTAGIIRDLSLDRDERGVMVIEANCMPPRCLKAMAQAFDGGAPAFVGITDDDEPAGLYLFDRTALEPIPRIGYFDIKEQLLPALSGRGLHVLPVRVTDRVLRIRDRQSYLAAVRATAEGHGAATPGSQFPGADIDSTARIVGNCVIEPRAVVEEGAVVHDSVLLDGAIVQANAVVSRSIVAPGVRVPPAGRVIDRVAHDIGSAELRRVAGGSAPARTRPEFRTLSNVTGNA